MCITFSNNLNICTLKPHLPLQNVTGGRGGGEISADVSDVAKTRAVSPHECGKINKRDKERDQLNDPKRSQKEDHMKTAE